MKGTTTIEISTLKALITPLIRVLAANPTIPILSYIRIQASGLTIIATATDLATTITTKEQLTTPSDFDVCVDGASLNLAIKNCTDTSFVISMDGSQMTLKAKRQKFVIPVEDSSEFPNTSGEILFATLFQMPLSTLSDMMHRGSQFTDDKSVSDSMHGVQIICTGSEVKFASASYIGLAEVKVSQKSANNPTIQASSDLLPILSAIPDYSMTVSTDGRRIRVEAEKITVTGTLVTSAIPAPYERVLTAKTAENLLSIPIDLKVLKTEMKSLLDFSNKVTNIAELCFGADGITIKATDETRGVETLAVIDESPVFDRENKYINLLSMSKMIGACAANDVELRFYDTVYAVKSKDSIALQAYYVAMPNS